MDKRLKEILARKQEIRTLLQGEGEINLQEVQEELRNLEDEEKQLNERRELAAGIAAGTVETRTVEKPQQPSNPAEVRNLKWNEAIETDEYRHAWIKDMMNMPVSHEERSFMDKVNDEYRAYTHTTENTAVLIPKTVVAGIWDRAAEVSSLWNDVKKFFVNGNLSMIKGDRNGGSDAEWYEEEDTVDTKKLGFGTVELTGCELARAIQVTWKLRKMSLPEFEQYIISEIGYKMGKGLAYGVYAGKGKPGEGDTFKPEPLGIKTVLAAESDTPQIVSYPTTGATFESLRNVMAALGGSYTNGASIYANQKTVWNVLAAIEDKQGRPLFISDVTAGGVGRLFGNVIKIDDAIPEGEVLYGNLARGYVANVNEDVTMYREEHIRQRLTDYMGYAIVDGAPLDNTAFVILTVDTPAG